MLRFFRRARGGAPVADAGFDARLELYAARLGDGADAFAYDDFERAFLVTKSAVYDDFLAWRRHVGWEEVAPPEGQPPFALRAFRGYVEPLLKLIAAHPVARDGAFLVCPSDNRFDFDAPYLVKSRERGKSGRTVLINLNNRRHWRFVPVVREADKPFAAKADRLVFRGGPTNVWPRVGERSLADAMAAPDRMSLGSHRFALYRRLVDGLGAHPMMDLGFTALKRETRSGARYKPFFEPGAPIGYVAPLSIEAQLDAKFLLSLEGHDVASGLRWMMSSNSVVLAPPPTRESWFLEGRLEPGRHFVAVRPDLSDLEERVEWCLTHPRECVEITKEAQEYVRDFEDPERESRLAQALLGRYAERVAIAVPPASLYGGYRARNLRRKDESSL